jgi:pimeloyl-ACP methyl ester carboxylesterase
VIIPDAGHGMQHDQPVLYVEALRAFLAGSEREE